MKKIYIISFFLLLFNFSFSQENRSERGWNEGNQSTYSIENIKELKGEGDDTRFEPVNSNFNGFEKNSLDIDSKSDITHRRSSVWSDNSTIVSDEKTGHHTYIPYSFVSEDDVLWAKRIRKKIDVRILQNHSLFFPVEQTYDDYLGWSGDGKSIQSKTKGPKKFNEVLSGIDARKNLFQILRDAATTINPETGEPLVSTYNMSLTRKLTAEEVIPNWDAGFPNAFGWKYDNSDEDDEETDWVYSWYEAKDIQFYYLEEEIFFDKRRAKLDFRFISITPVVKDPESASGTLELPTFYFPEIRHLLANHKIFPLDGNVAQRMSFDEFFHRKLFASNIIKETNVYDRKISDYLPGRTLEQLLEGERIREQIRRYESDMWNY